MVVLYSISRHLIHAQAPILQLLPSSSVNKQLIYSHSLSLYPPSPLLSECPAVSPPLSFSLDLCSQLLVDKDYDSCLCSWPYNDCTHHL